MRDLKYLFKYQIHTLIINIVQRMQIALKKQAETYFQSVTDFEKAHNDLTDPKNLHRYYTLLISRYLTSNQLIAKIKILHESKKIQWQVFADALWGLSLILADNNATLTSLAQFIATIDSLNIIDRSLLLKSLPQNLIDLAGLEKKQTLKKKTQRAHRKFYFDQKKHNLMRQNNEGYARLSLLLATLSQNSSSEKVWNKIISLIGNFDLDPDRVLDLLIESYLQSADPQVCLTLIKNFNPQSIVALVGNRMLKQCPPDIAQKLIYAGKVENFITGSSEQLYKELSNIPNPKLIKLICKFIKQRFITLESISPYLTPNDSILERQESKRLTNGKQKIAKSFKLLMDQLTTQQINKLKQEQNLKFLGQLLHSSKLALINGFACQNDWKNFTQIWEIYHEKIDLIIYQPLLKTLLDLLQWIIQPLFSKISLQKFFKTKYQLPIKFNTTQRDFEQESRQQMTQCRSLNDQQFKKIIQIFDIIKIYIGFKSKLYIKICRLFTSIIKQSSVFAEVQKNQQMEPEVSVSPYIKQNIQRITRLYLLPGMSLQTGNSALNKQLYQLLELFNYRFRYRCYMYHYNEGMTINPLLANIFYKTRNKQTIIVNNLSDKNKKVFMKKMAKLTHNQALQTFYWIFRRILMEDYQKVVPEIVGVLASSCFLTLQMTIFIALHILNEQKQPAMNFRTGQQTPWFKNLINFISLFYRKYLQIDIQPMFDYIIMKIGEDVSTLEQNQELPGALLGLLHQILSKMFCNFVFKEINKSKLEMLCAGPYLQLEAMDISSQIKASKKSKLILQKFFWGKSLDQYDGQSLAISLLVLLTQKRAELLHKSYISNLKIIGGIYDDYTTLIIQLIRVLNELSTGYVQYSKLLPQNSLNLLINEYKLPIQIAFQIYRPSVKHISVMNPQQWTLYTNSIGGVMNKFFSSGEKYIHGYSQNEKLKSYLNENYSKISNIISNEFFTTFWMLTLDSVYFPTKLYSEKIQQVKKKAQTKSVRGAKNQKAQREVEKAKSLLINLKNEQIQQSKKVQETMSQICLARLKVEYFKHASKDSKDDKSISLAIQQFVEIFVQVCLLPRMMLDPEEALYCMKITLEVIKTNKLSSGKSIKLLIFIIEHVMNYIPYATEREASYCLAIFLSEILNILTNWNDPTKLKQDLKKWLGIQESFVDSSYTKLKKQFIKLFVRFGNIVKSIKDEPYNIRNCLYLLEKVDIIPAYKKQAEDLQNYLKQLKQKYSQTLITIIQMQLSIIGQKKKTLPIIEDDGQVVARNQMPTFSNLSNVDSKIPFTSPFRSPMPYKNNQLVQSAGQKPASFDVKVQVKQKQSQRQKQKQNISERERERDREKQKQRQRQQQKINRPQTPLNQKSLSLSSRQNGQKQSSISLEKKQQNIKPNVENENIISSTSHQGAQIIAQKKVQQQRQRSQQNKDLGSKNELSQSIERIKTVKQIRDENARKAAQLNQPIVQSQSKPIQPQQNEKMKKQNKRDPTLPRGQKTQWPNQWQREDRDKQKSVSVSPMLEFSRKNSIQAKRSQFNQQVNRVDQTQDREKLKIEQAQNKIKQFASPTIQIKQTKHYKEDNVQPINQQLKLDKKDQQFRPKQIFSLSQDRSPNRQKDKQRDNRRQAKVEWRKGEKQDRYSPERNLERQRQIKNRPYEQKDKRVDSRWKEREDYRREREREDRDNRYNQEKRIDSRDKSRRKQDKYDKFDKTRRHDNKGKDRSRER